MKPKLMILIGILLVGLLVGGAFLITTQLTGITGSSMLSLSRVDLQSNFAPLNGKQVWVYTFRQGGLGQYATGTVKPSQADEKYPGKKKPKQDFSMKVTYDKQECIYPTKIRTQLPDKQLMSLYEVAYSKFGNCNFYSEGKQKCQQNGDVPLLYYTTLSSKKCRVICGSLETGAIGEFGTRKINAKFTVAVGSEGKNYHESFETLTGKSKGKVGDNTYIIWNGFLGTGRECPDKDPFRPIYRYGSWKVVDFEAYNSYIDYINTIGTAVRSGVTTQNQNDAKLFIETANKLKNEALRTKSFGSFDRVGSLNNALLKVPLERGNEVVLPTITAYIKTDWLGITTPIGKPKVVSAKSLPFSSSSGGSVRTVIRNDGDDLGAFKVTVDCPPPFESFDYREITLDPGKSQTLVLPISADVKKTTKSKCWVVATGTQYSDKLSFTVQSDPNYQCTPGNRRCDISLTKIEECIDGVEYRPVEDCSRSSQVCKRDSNGNPVCTDVNNPPPPPPSRGEICYNDIDDDQDGKIDELDDCYCEPMVELLGKEVLPDIPCKFNKWITPKIRILAIFLAVIAMLITYIGSEFTLSKNKIKTSDWAIPKFVLLGILSLLIGAIVGLLVLWIWWLAIVILIVYSVGMLLLSALMKLLIP